MKIITALLSLAAATSALSAEIRITGATAFRASAIKTIAASYSPGFLASYSNGTLQTANQAVFQGNFPGIAGVTTIRCSWNGAVEGIRAIHNNTPLLFLSETPTATGNADGTGGSVKTATSSQTAHFAFSDCAQSSTPFTANTLYPGDPAIGVVVFAFVANNGASPAITGMTSQLANALLTTGSQPLSMWSGLPADDNKQVYLTGRNDGSGTRTITLAEPGYGASQLIKQYKPTVVSNNITTLRLWPLADGVNLSDIWNPDTAGNGGFFSGGAITSSMRSTSGAVQIQTAAGVNVGSPSPVSLITYQSASDAFQSQRAATGTEVPARLLSFNGAPALTYKGSGTALDPYTLSDASVNDVARGRYTFWSYEVLYSNVDLASDADLNTVYQAIKAGSTTQNLGLSGISLEAMLVARGSDGGVVAP